MPSISSRSSLCAWSFSFATGSTRSSTNARTVSWIRRCSSVSSKSIAAQVYGRDGYDARRMPYFLYPIVVIGAI